MFRCISVWDDSTCPFLMTKITATVSHCHSTLTNRQRKTGRGEKWRERFGVNIQRGGVITKRRDFYNASWFNMVFVSSDRCVCASIWCELTAIALKKQIRGSPKGRAWTGALFPSVVLYLWQKYQLFIAGEHFYSVLLVCGLILLGCLGDMHIRKTTQPSSLLTDFLSSRETLSTVNQKVKEHIHTCQWGGTPQTPPVSS